MGLISGIPRYSCITHSSAELAALHTGILGSSGIPRAGTTMLLPNSGTNFQSAGSQGIAQDGGEEILPFCSFPRTQKVHEEPSGIADSWVLQGGND